MSKRYFIRVFSLDEEEGVKSVLDMELEPTFGNFVCLEDIAEELTTTNFFEALGVKNYIMRDE